MFQLYTFVLWDSFPIIDSFLFMYGYFHYYGINADQRMCQKRKDIYTQTVSADFLTGEVWKLMVPSEAQPGI